LRLPPLFDYDRQVELAVAVEADVRAVALECCEERDSALALEEVVSFFAPHSARGRQNSISSTLSPTTPSPTVMAPPLAQRASTATALATATTAIVIARFMSPPCRGAWFRGVPWLKC
jgi:hypothetical protein